MRRSLCLMLSGFLGFALSVCATDLAPTFDWTGPDRVAYLESPALNETSGLAASHLARDLLWTHNDSGDQPVIRAIDQHGQLRATVRLRGARNVDWEDMASFELDGTAYLLIADVGDNQSRRTDCMIYVIAEPTLNPSAAPQDLFVDIAWQIPVRYPDGPRDCESVAVDPTEGMIYLLSKRTKPSVVYQLPLRPSRASPGRAPAATRIGEVHGIPPPSGLFAKVKIPTGLYRAQPCALDISSDGRTAAVLTYGEVYLYNKPDGASWRDAFAGQPLVLKSHGLPQAEAICFSLDGRAIFVTTEGHPAPLLRYTLTDHPADHP